MKSKEKDKGDRLDLSDGAMVLDVEDFLSGGRLPFEKTITTNTTGQGGSSSVVQVPNKTEVKGKTTGTDQWVARTILLRSSVVEKLEKVARDEEKKVSQVIRYYVSRGLRRAEEKKVSRLRCIA